MTIPRRARADHRRIGSPAEDARPSCSGHRHPDTGRRGDPVVDAAVPAAVSTPGQPPGAGTFQATVTVVAAIPAALSPLATGRRRAATRAGNDPLDRGHPCWLVDAGSASGSAAGHRQRGESTGRTRGRRDAVHSRSGQA